MKKGENFTPRLQVMGVLPLPVGFSKVDLEVTLPTDMKV